MRIGQKRAPQQTSRLGILAAVLLFFLIGLTVGNPRWIETAVSTLSNPAELFSFLRTPADLPTLTVDMPFENFNVVLQQREAGLAQGVVLGTEEDFVNADVRLTVDGTTTTIPVRMRLQQGLADGLSEGEKWAYDIRTRQDSDLLGMSRFTLQDPASNNWLNQWLFAKSLEQSGLLATRYQFVRLVFNGDERGIYALQEGFGDELILGNSREVGVMVEFDAARLWEATAYYAGDIDAAFADPATNLSLDDYQFFEVDTFRDRNISRDEALTTQKNNAIGLLRSLQSGDVAASEIFDIGQYGAFLAFVDLFGATDAVSLANLRYYYNPATGRLEPIGYNGNPLSDEARVKPIHFYHDSAIQEVYVQTAVQLADPAYIDQLEATFGEELNALRRTLADEVELAAPWETLRARQALLQRTLSPVQPAFAYLGPPEMSMQAIIQIDVANTLNLPLEVLGFDLGGELFMAPETEWIQGEGEERVLLEAGENGRFVLASAGDAPQYVRFHLSLIEIYERKPDIDFLRNFDINVVTRLVGLSGGQQLSLARPGYPVPILPSAN